MDVKMTYGSNANLASVPIENGAIRAVKDTKELYIDLDGERTNFSGAKEKIVVSDTKPTDENTNIWFEVLNEPQYKVHTLTNTGFLKEGIPFYLTLNNNAVEEELSVLTLNTNCSIKPVGSVNIETNTKAYIYLFSLNSSENNAVTQIIKLKINNKDIQEEDSKTVSFITNTNYYKDYVYKDKTSTLSSNYEYKCVIENNNLIGFDIFDSSNSTIISDSSDIKIYYKGNWTTFSDPYSDSWNGDIYSIRFSLNDFISNLIGQSTGLFLLNFSWYFNAESALTGGYTTYLIYDKDSDTYIEIESLKN